MIKSTLLLVLVLLPYHLSAQVIEGLRGGWIVDQAGERHIYYIVLRDNKVSGTYCYNCENPANLAFIDDGEINGNNLSFTIYHYPSEAVAYQEFVEAKLIQDELHLNISRSGAEVKTVILHRTRPEDIIRLPMPDSTTNTQAGGTAMRSQARLLPGPAETFTVEKVSGLWLWGTGPGKQHFMFKQHKGQIRGMVCGPCNSAPDMAPLEGINMEGSNFHFEIVHEDNGLDFDKHGPHSNVTDAQISKHEMHMSVTPSFEKPGFIPIEMTLLGPIAD